jgi:hypothetical protein
MPDVRKITVTIEETVFGFHLVEADGPAMGPCFATGRMSIDAFGRACYAAAFGEFPDGEWETDKVYSSPYAFGMDRNKVISKMRENEKAATLTVRGVEPTLATLAAEFISEMFARTREFPTWEETRHYLAYVGGWEDDDEHTEKCEKEVRAAGWARA